MRFFKSKRQVEVAPNQTIRETYLRECKDENRNPEDFNFDLYTVNLLRDSEGDLNRGWQVDLFTISIYNNKLLKYERVGYMKVAYIPTERFETHYAEGVMDFLAKISGRCWGKTKREIIGGWSDSPYWNRGEELELLTDEEVEKVYAQYKRKLEKSSHGKQFKDFKQYFENKPYVDFGYINEVFRQKGLYRLLYIAATDFYSVHGMNLYTSSLKSPVAQKAWEKIEKTLPSDIVLGQEVSNYGRKTTRKFLKKIK